MNNDHTKSAQPCGCDEGANHKCLYHGGPGPSLPTVGRASKAVSTITSTAGPGPAPSSTATTPSNVGMGGAPTRATTLPTDAAARKTFPVASGVLDYFPDALAAVAHVSYTGNEQHNPGKPLHWDRSKSSDESDTMMRHFLQRGTRDDDGQRHSAKMVWRALAILQKEIEGEGR